MHLCDVVHQMLSLVELFFAQRAVEHDDLAVDLLQVVLQVDLGRVLLVAEVAGELLEALVHHLQRFRNFRVPVQPQTKLYISAMLY